MGECTPFLKDAGFPSPPSAFVRHRATLVCDVSLARKPAVGPRVSAESLTSGEAFLCVDRLLDTARIGPTYLARASIAQIVIDSLQYCGEIDYRLHAWVVMPNHVHMLATTRTGVSKFMRRLKGYTARRANELLSRTGQPFWQEESYDHLVRTPEEFRNIEAYILKNPVKAGLARTAEEYRWSSAYAK